MMAAAGMDSTTVDGTNVNLNDPIGKTIRYLGYAVVSAVLVSDADVAQVTDAETDEYLDLVTIHTLEALLGHLDDVDIRVGPRTESLSQLAAQVERLLAKLSAKADKEYGFGMATVTTGYIQKDIAEHD